ncbi:MAG: signal peptidase II [Erysipelotrichaceae bacterium]|nr:signal peptidase II [Erysipelotrichaceae bacterium]
MIASILFVILLVVLDQASKIYLTLVNKTSPIDLEVIRGFFRITYTCNDGAAFSILKGKRVFFIIMTIIVVFLIVYYLLKNKVYWVEKYSLLLIISGALGNLIDRIMYGYVIDFLDFIIFGYDFPVFNIADSFITIGAIGLIISILFLNKEGENAGN